MLNKEKLELQIAKINNEIGRITEIVIGGNTPEFDNLNALIENFTNEIKNLDEKEIVEFTNLIKIWSDELKNIIEKIANKKDEIQDKLESAMHSNQAYNKYKNPVS
ncbi:MAG: hypothetical protein SFT90_08530 [Rickettsiales bacterium]|nr:hypothetical protein [Rickettsiales bacterium]